MDQGYADMLEYCADRLRWAEGAAMQRLTVARAASLYPEIYSYLGDGELNLSAVSRLSAHLTAHNRTSILTRAAGLRRVDLDKLISELRACRPVPAVVPMDLPETTVEAALPLTESTPSASHTDVGPPKIETCPALAIERRERVAFLVDERVRMDLERTKELLKTTCPSGALEEVVAYLIRDFLRRRDPERRVAARERPPRSLQTRGIPQWIKDRVWRRDAGRCAYVSAPGRRCERRQMLEYDHVRPWARGGSSDDPANIRLLCRAHNQHVARRTFGDRS